MKIENISTGQVFKNYKELCLELEMEIKKSPDTKKAQLKEFSRYCKFNKIGHKIYIEEVYETPLPRIENRGKNSIYGNLIQLLIADLLAQCNGHISISRSKLMTAIGMVNHNYSEGKELVQKLSVYTEIEEKVIYDFYNTSTSSFKSLIETALNALMDKRVIMFNKVIKVSRIGSYVPTIATEKELEIIMTIEKTVMEEMGYKQISAVRISKDWNDFKKKTKIQLHEQSNINYYYTAYDITVHEKFIVQERNELVNLLLEQVKRQESKGELNQVICTNLLINAQKRHEKAFTSKKMGKVRNTDLYIENFKQLIELLIDKDAPNILQKVRNIQLESDLFTPEMIDEIDNLLSNL